MIDRHAASIASDHRDDLGGWIRRRLKKGVEGQGGKAQGVLDQVGIHVEELRAQWELQQASQLSVRARTWSITLTLCICNFCHLDAPARLKKELDTVLNLQADLDAVDSAIQSTHALISKSEHPTESLNLLASLQETHESLKEKVEALYTSLNVHETFPELQGLDFEFVRTLLMARDLKINIRKRAIGSFFEWDKLDQAAGGREQALG